MSSISQPFKTVRHIMKRKRDRRAVADEPHVAKVTCQSRGLHQVIFVLPRLLSLQYYCANDCDTGLHARNTGIRKALHITPHA